MTNPLSVSLLHVLLIAPLLLFIGFTKDKYLNKVLFSLILAGGISVLAYHLYLVSKKGLNRGFILLLHAILFAPLLIYIGIMGLYNKDKVFWGAYWLLQVLGFAAVGYHSYKLFMLL